ncbi:MAG: helix-turn-helix domain-containing protein [Bacilli bacterium]|nr:helix-turn-helix domain-containing protein [Bacilli bacterium]
MKELNEIVSENLVYLRKSRHLTQQELAEEIGYSDKSISKWELGKSIPSVDILLKFSEYYGISVDDLIHEDTIIKSHSQVMSRRKKTNDIIVFAMAAMFVWFTAACIFLNGYVFNPTEESKRLIWIAFLWAAPVMFLVDAFFIRLMWKKCLPYWVMLSGFIWTLITAFYVTYLVAMGQNLWFIYLAALPVQIIVILFARLQ